MEVNNPTALRLSDRSYTIIKLYYKLMKLKANEAVFLLILILIVASFLRLYSLNSIPPGLYSDEAMNGNNALEALRHRDFRVFYTENNGREGLFMNIQAVFLAALGTEPTVLRLPSAIFGILTVVGVYFLTKELFKTGGFDLLNIDENVSLAAKALAPARGLNLQKLNYVALLAAFLIATSFWHINFSRIAFRAIMAPFFLTWGLYFLLLSFRKSAIFHQLISEKSQIPSAKSQTNHNDQNPKQATFWNLGFRIWILAVLGGLVYGLGMHSYIAYRATPLLIAFSLGLLAFRYGWKLTLKIGSIFIIASIIVFLPLGFYFLENPADFFGRTSQISVWQSPTPFKDFGLNILKTAGMFNIAGDWNPRHNIPGKPLLYWPVGILFLVGLIVAIRRALVGGAGRIAFSILLIWLVVTALPVVISNEGIPHALRSILMAPAIFILAAVGGAWLYKKIHHLVREQFFGKVIKFIIVIGFIGLITFNAYTSYFLDWTKRPEVAEAFNQKYVQIAEKLNTLPLELPKYVVVDTGGHDVREIGTPAQTIMYLTDTYLEERQKAKNLFYIQPSELPEVPKNSFIIEL